MGYIGYYSTNRMKYGKNIFSIICGRYDSNIGYILKKYEYYCVQCIILTVSCQSHAGIGKRAIIDWDSNTSSAVVVGRPQAAGLRVDGQALLHQYACKDQNTDYQRVQ